MEMSGAEREQRQTTGWADEIDLWGKMRLARKGTYGGRKRLLAPAAASGSPEFGIQRKQGIPGAPTRRE